VSNKGPVRFKLSESNLCQALLRKGEAREARKTLPLQGRSHFGEPTPEVVAALEAETDLSRLDEVAVAPDRPSEFARGGPPAG
jgi:hypothetical protein